MIVSLLVGVVVTFVSSLIPALRSTRVPPIAALHAFAPTPTPAPPAASTSSLSILLGVAGLALVLVGLLGSADAGAARRPDRRRRGRDRDRRLALQPAPGAAAGDGRRLAAGAAAPPDRPAGARERPAQPEPHRGHRGGADDRPRPGHLRHRLRRRAEELGRPGRRRKLRRRPGDPEQRRLLADPERDRDRRRARCRASNWWRRSARRRRSWSAAAPAPRSRRRPRTSKKRSRSNGSRAGPRPCATCSDDQAIVSDSFASAHGLEVGDRFRLLSQTRRRPSFEVVGEFDSKLGVFGSVLVTQAALARDFAQTQDTIDFVETDARAPTPPTVQALLTKVVEAAFPIAEVLNQQELKESREEQVDTARQPLLRAAGAGDRDLAVRDRQHAGALDPRTHPGAGDAAGDRDVAPPGADDDPLRGGDHGPDRGDPRDGPGRRSSRP